MDKETASRIAQAELVAGKMLRCYTACKTLYGVEGWRKQVNQVDELINGVMVLRKIEFIPAAIRVAEAFDTNGNAITVILGAAFQLLQTKYNDQTTPTLSFREGSV